MLKSIFQFLQLCLLLFLSACSLQKTATQAIDVSSFRLVSMTVVSYTSTQAKLSIKGTIITAVMTPQSVVTFYTDAACSANAIGNGLASDFTSQGITLLLPTVGSYPIYAQTNSFDGCFSMGTFTFNPSQPSAPVLTKSIPSSPSRSVASPALVGQALQNSTVNFFSDSTCSTSVGNGSSDLFATTGVQVILPPNSITTIYGQTTDSLGNISVCGLVGTYQHTNQGPTSPVYYQILPASPNNKSSTPLVTGSVSADTQTVTLFSDASCSTFITSGDAGTFTTTGLQVTAAANNPVTIYAEAFNTAGLPSACTFLTNYLYDTVAPTGPTYIAASPATPTNQTIYPLITGSVGTDSDIVSVKFYNDPLCLVNIGSGTKLSFTTTGITASVTQNAWTTIYATDVDAATNESSCTHLVDYYNNIVPPNLPVFSATYPISPNNVSATPLISGNASDTTVTLQFYSDDSCQTLIGQGTADDFNNSGITINTPNIPNQINTTTVYATATDAETNVTDCTYMATYGYSTAKAAAPYFVSSSPVSPSRISYMPTIYGSAPNTVAKIELYADTSCTSLLGSTSRSMMATIGLPVTLPMNTSTNIYGQSRDVYGNDSDCILFTNYIHDNMKPLPPSYSSTNPASPTNQTIDPLILGSVSQYTPGKVLTTTKISFYDSNLCLTSLGTDVFSIFSTPGISIEVAPNAITSVYAQTLDAAGNRSDCTYMTDFLNDTNPPGKPVLTSFTPASPSYTRKTLVKGTIATSFDIAAINIVNFYTDNSCATLLGTGSVSGFTGSGISVVVGENQTTPIYAQSVDVIGNKSTCNHFVDYFHNDIGPANLSVSQNLDGSTTLNWLTDSTASPSAKYVIKRSEKSGGPYAILSWVNASNSYTDYSVTNNQTYYYVVDATNNTGTSNDSAEVSITISTSSTITPTSLSLTPGPAVIVLSWQGYTPNMFYTVLRSTQSGGPYTQVATGLNGATYTDASVTNGTSYFYVVQGLNPSGGSVQSNEASATPMDIPNAPQNLQLRALNSAPDCGGNPGVYLTWDSPKYYTKFVVRRSATSHAEIDLATTTANTFFDCDPPGTSSGTNPSIFYSVQASWGPSAASVRSADSNEVGFKYYAATTVTLNPGNHQIYVNWLTIAGAASYQVWRGTQSGWPNSSYVELSAATTGSNYYDGTTVNGTAYFYVIIANYTGVGGNYPSTEVSAVPDVNPATIPQNLHIVQATGSNQPLLTWSPTGNYNYFNIYRATSAGGTYSAVAQSTTPSYTDALSTGGTFYYKVSAQWGSYETGFTNIVPYSYGASATITATASATSIAIAWTAVTGAASYNLYRGTNVGSMTLIANQTALTFTNSISDSSYPVVGGTGYFYYVVPVLTDGNTGQPSALVSAMMTGDTTPSGLTVIGTTSSSVTLQWAKVTSAATGYTIYKATSSAGPYTSVGSTYTSSSTAITIGSLTSGTLYYFKVSSASCGVGCQSAYAQAYAYNSPYPPAASPMDSGANITWTGVGANSYNLYRSGDEVNFSLISSGVTGGSYTDSGLTNGTIYYYKVEAVYSSQSIISGISNAVTPGITPKIPQGITVSNNASGTDVTMSWAVVSGATSYKVYLGSSSSGPWGTAVLNTASSTANFIGSLTSGTVYYTVVTALNGSMESGTSTAVSFVPSAQPAAPTVKVSGITAKVNLSWSSVSGASTYDLYRSLDGFLYTPLATGISATTYVDSSASSNVPYSYEFLPRTSGGIQMAMSAASLPLNIEFPLVPKNLVATASNTSTTNLSWVPSTTTQVTTYNIYRSTTSGSGYSNISSITATNCQYQTCQYQDTSPTAGTTYYYVVTALLANGAESGNSNEVGLNLSSGPASLLASNVSNKVSLSWSSVGGASSYTLRRSTAASGPFGPIATQSGTTYLDNNVTNGVTYYYVVCAVNSSGYCSADSNVATITSSRVMNLQIPIELMDQAMSSDSTPVIFQRTRTSLDTNAYDGTITYQFELVGNNTDTVDGVVHLVDSSGTTVGSITIPAGTSSATRLRSTFTPNSGLSDYRLQLPGTTNPEQVHLYSARMLVTQVGATKTKIYLPLMSSENSPSLGDIYMPTYSTSSTGYAVPSESTLYLRDLTKYKQLAQYNPFEFEALVSSYGGTGLVGLYNLNQSGAVDDSEVEFNSTDVTLVNSEFNDGVDNFLSPTNDLNYYAVAVQCLSNCDSGAVNIYKAGLWIKLENLNKMDIIYRNALANFSTGDGMTSLIVSERSQIDLSVFSNPTVDFRVVGTAPMGVSATVNLKTAGQGASAASTTAGLTNVSGASLMLSTGSLQYLQTSSNITINSLDQFVTEITSTGGTTQFIDSSIVIHASP